MRPLTVLIGIVMGSTVSIAVGLLLTWIVILFLPAEADVFAPEKGALIKAVVLFWALAAVAATSFYGELRERTWRVFAHIGIVFMLGIAVWVYWPQGTGG